MFDSLMDLFEKVGFYMCGAQKEEFVFIWSHKFGFYVIYQMCPQQNLKLAWLFFSIWYQAGTVVYMGFVRAFCSTENCGRNKRVQPQAWKQLPTVPNADLILKLSLVRLLLLLYWEKVHLKFAYFVQYFYKL